MLAAIAISFLTIIVSILLVGKFSSRQFDDLHAVQATHSRPTSRLGGLALFFGLLTIYFKEPFFLDSSVLLFSCLPIFMSGLMEDLTGKVVPSVRFVSSILSAGFAIYFSGLFLVDVDIFFVNSLLIIAPVGIIFTLLASSGVVNSFNLIDGLNGFAGGLGIVIASILGYLCIRYGEQNLALICFFLIAALIPFFVFNFPLGLIFLGDAGAYMLGHILCWVAIILFVRNPDLSSWTILLLFAWPITDTLFSIFRRIRSKRPSGAADRFHFHHLVLQFFLLRFDYLKKNPRWANSISTIFLLPVASFPVVFSIFVLEKNLISFIAYTLFLIFFIFVYLTLVSVLKSLAKNNGKMLLEDDLNHIFRPRNR